MPLAPHPTPLTAAAARHLLRRTGFGAPPSRVAPLVGLSARSAALRLLAEAAASPALDDPAWYTRGESTQSLAYTESETILRRALAEPVREKLTLFWHNHFVTEVRVYTDARYAWQYYRFLRDNALGKVRPLVHGIGTSGAMLRYLNGNTNTRTAPNQNYARELLELFTMGQYGPDGVTLNYTESDIVAAARALTGWRTRSVTNGLADTYFDASRFDTGSKTILGQTGAWGYDDVVRIVFEQRREPVARFLARKLLAFYATHTPDPADEAALAETLLATDFDIPAALADLWASQTFHASTGALVKSPIDVLLGFLGDVEAPGATVLMSQVRTAARDRGQAYFDPPDVAGWDGLNPPTALGRPGYLAWYTSGSFGPLWASVRALAQNTSNRSPYDLVALGRLAGDPDDPFDVALAVATHLVALSLDVASIPALDAPLAGNASIPPPVWTKAAPAYVTDLAKLLLGATTPHYEWKNFGATSRETRLRTFVTFLTTELPEYLLG